MPPSSKAVPIGALYPKQTIAKSSIHVIELPDGKESKSHSSEAELKVVPNPERHKQDWPGNDDHDCLGQHRLLEELRDYCVHEESKEKD